MAFPYYRPRRMRARVHLRRMVREASLAIEDLTCPLFAVHGSKVREEISSMPGVFHLSVDRLAEEAHEVASLGIPAILLFGLPARKDKQGSEAYAEDGIVQQAVRAIRAKDSELVIVTDVCLCGYTTHGHCGIVHNGRIDNDATLELLAQIALSHAQAGADLVAPSAMMDGQVKAIRHALDGNGFSKVSIMSYAAKYASSFYGPFREATDCAPGFGDRSAYQMDPANAREALREVALDIKEGADIVMVKPALAYLDVIYRVKQRFGYPLAAYNVSGEYGMLKAASLSGWIDETRAVLEALTAMRRAGADLIITYYAKEVARWLKT